MTGPRKWATAAAFCAAIGYASSAAPSVFKNRFIEFETPERWSCALENTEYVCQDTRPELKKDSIIIFAAKLRGNQDTLAAYRDHLGRSKKQRDPNGKEVVSKVLSVKNVVRNGLTWVESIQDDSEIIGFRTHYLAVVRDPIAVLVTFTINRSKYNAQAPRFESMVRTLKIKTP